MSASILPDTCPTCTRPFGRRQQKPISNFGSARGNTNPANGHDDRILRVDTPRLYPYRIRSYRFGILFSLAAFAWGVYLAIVARRPSADPIYIIYMAIQAMWAMLTGFGLLRKRPYGLVLLMIASVAEYIDLISEWTHLPSASRLWGGCWRGAWLAGVSVVAIYFLKRWREFSRNPFLEALGDMDHPKADIPKK